jgi:hypothetical protein
MRVRHLLAFGIATALGGVPSFASAAESAVPESSALEVEVVPIVAAVAVVSVAGTLLLMRRRQRPGTEPATAAERATRAADDEAITAALQARTLRRGRMRLDDDAGDGVPGSAPPRGTG